MNNDELIEKASLAIKPRRMNDRLYADVGCALLSAKDNVFTGVCLDPSTGSTICAEQAAIAAMVTAGEYEIAKIVAVWKDDNGRTHVIAPCGCCRELMRQINSMNMDTDILLGDKTTKLSELLPAAGSFVLID